MELSEWINPAYLADDWLDTAAARYASAEPYPHMQVTDWLVEERFSALDDALAEHKFIQKESDLFSLAQTEDLSEASEGILGEYVAFLNSPELRDWFETVTGVPTTPGGLDLFGAIYQDTGYLLPHDDQLEGRRIAFILYVTGLEFGQGGALAIYDDDDGHPGNVVKRLRPEPNALNFFTVSDESWHEVEEVTADVYRVSLGGWLHG